MSAIIKLGRHAVEITHPDKVLFPDDGITKVDLIEYYQEIAPYMLPHLKNRPVTMQRFPEGITGEGFYHKDAPDYFPAWIERVTVKKEGGVVHHVVCNNAATLVYLANQACITPHVWLSTIKKIRYPDRMIIDLDPPEGNFPLACVTALGLKDLLEDFGLCPFVMTTGSKGLHVVVPLKPVATFDTVRMFARQLAELFVQHNQKTITTEIRKEKRGKKLFLDTNRNAYAQTGVCAYAVRARPGAPVATPLFWEELHDPRLTAQRYTIKTIFKRLKHGDQPWTDINKHERSLVRAAAMLQASLISKKGDPS